MGLEEMEWSQAGMLKLCRQYEVFANQKQYEDKTTKTLMMLPTDMALVSDKAFKQWVDKYAKDEELFFKDFSAVIVKLFELGVPFDETTQQAPMTLKPLA